MDKETLSNYGWIVICVMVLAVMLAFASPFGNFVANAIKATTQGLFDVNQNALDAAGIQIMEQEFENMLNGNGSDPALNPSNVTLTDNTYSHGDYIYTRPITGNSFGASTLEEAWEALYAELSAQGMTWQDLVEMYAQYGYTEEQVKAEMGLTQETFAPAKVEDFWNVEINLNVTDKNQKTYGPILESINGIPVTDLTSTFANCTLLETAPVIPNSITTMVFTFGKCSSLKTAPTIPSSVINMMGAFQECTSLISTPDLSKCNNLTSLEQTFMDCTNLASIAPLPANVKTLRWTFSGCTSLTVAPDLSKCTKIEDMANTFNGCTSLTDISGVIIPNTVTNMFATFAECTSLTDASSVIIPSSVTNMEMTFTKCTALTGTLNINANPTEWQQCLWTTQVNEIKGQTTMGNSILITKTNGGRNPVA